ncbi:MAG: HAD family hydrolase [archaeon GB-1867-005]|nr:HAD family hydrolase [Candidatus Culexmicrobium cathedralense]
MLSAISFDFGGTLARELKEEHQVFHEILMDLGYSVEVELVKEALSAAWDWWLQEKARTGRVWSEEALKDVIKLILRRVGALDIEKLVLKAVELYPYKLEFEVYPDVEPALKKLEQLRYRLTVISNASSQRNVEIYLEKLGLKRYFDLVVVSGTIGYEKPNPKIFHAAAEMLGVEPREILHVGNDYEADYLGAKMAGLKSILIDRDGVHGNKQCNRISNLTELLGILGKLEQI